MGQVHPAHYPARGQGRMAEGRPELTGKVVGFQPVIDSQAWVINKLTHKLGDGGLVTDIELEMKLDKFD